MVRVFTFVVFFSFFSFLKPESLSESELIEVILEAKRAQSKVGPFKFGLKLELEGLKNQALEKLGFKQKKEGRIFSLVSKLKIFFSSFPLILFQILFFIFWILFLLSFLNKAFFAKRFLNLFFSLFFFSLSIFSWQSSDFGLVIKNDSKMLSGPSQSNPEIKSLKKGLIIKILEQKDDFFKVETEGSRGWISSDFFIKI